MNMLLGLIFIGVALYVIPRGYRRKMREIEINENDEYITESIDLIKKKASDNAGQVARNRAVDELVTLAKDIGWCTVDDRVVSAKPSEAFPLSYKGLGSLIGFLQWYADSHREHLPDFKRATLGNEESEYLYAQIALWNEEDRESFFEGADKFFSCPDGGASVLRELHAVHTAFSFLSPQKY